MSKKYRDEICRLGNCINADVCRGLCPPLIWINGKCKTKEILLSKIQNIRSLEYKNYNETLSELAEHQKTKREQRQEQLLSIIEEQNSRAKLIKLALLAGYQQSEIASYFHISSARVTQILYPTKKAKPNP